MCPICSRRPADPGRTAFDLCRTARNGVILLAGRRIYPWRVRKGQPERFGDHICRQFDSRRGIARWGVAPDIAGLENTWRGVRVAFARPDDGVVVPFLRAMAVRIPGRKTSELVPKTSLVEDPALIDLAGPPLRAQARLCPRVATMTIRSPHRRPHAPASSPR